MAVHVIDEANRCLNCKKPMCREGCPINTPIPQMIQAFKKGNLNEAGEMLFTNNPMSLSLIHIPNKGLPEKLAAILNRTC